MNALERLSNAHKENYNRYLRRMTDSMKFSTKGMIPILAKDGKNILDVGCGSGVLLTAIESENHKAKLTGLDLNIDAINRLKVKSNWKLIHGDFMDLVGVKYDTIIFSSILHEISSYNSDLDKRFTDIPIKEALMKARDLLINNGTIILRDGLLSSNDRKDNKLIVTFTKPEDKYWLYKFKEDFRGFDKLDINTEITELEGNKYMVSEGFLKEFLCTYTWGEESYAREVQERFGILTKEEWVRILESLGFKIETLVESKEEYEKYLSDRIGITDIEGNSYDYPCMTITIKAIKR